MRLLLPLPASAAPGTDAGTAVAIQSSQGPPTQRMASRSAGDARATSAKPRDTSTSMAAKPQATSRIRGRVRRSPKFAPEAATKAF